MLTPVVTRIQEIMDAYNLNLPQFAIELGYTSPQKIYRLFNTSQASPSCQIIEDIGRKFDKIDLNWLLIGEGNIYKAEIKSIDYKEKYYECLESKIGVYERALQKQYKIFEHFKDTNNNDMES